MPGRRALILVAVVLALALGPWSAARAQYVMALGDLIAAIQIGDLNEAVEGVHRANVVYVARVSELAGIRVSGERLTRVVARRGGVLRYFRAAIRGAQPAQRALEIHGQTLDQVIYATFTNDRTATLYVDDR
jgi:hypothetical protein